MKTEVLFFLCLATLLGSSSGLSVGPVRLCNHQRYLSYHAVPSASTTLIECPYQLTAGEEVARVYWQMWDDANQVGAYEWDPANRGQEASGRLKGVVDLNREDGGLQLTKLRYDLLGEYLCGVELTTGQRISSSKEEVLVIDETGGSLDSSHYGTCNLTASYSSPAVYPEPTLRAGMYSAEFHDYYEKVTRWNKTHHNNGSVTYFYKDAIFQIDESSPEQVSFKIEMGVTKADGTFISLLEMAGSAHSWNEHGCPAVRTTGHRAVQYLPASNVVCRGGYNTTTKATVTCQDGYRADGNVATLVLLCHGTTRAWRPEHGTTATLHDLKCVKDDGSKAAVLFSSGSPSLVLLCASLTGFVLLFISSRPYVGGLVTRTFWGSHKVTQRNKHVKLINEDAMAVW